MNVKMDQIQNDKLRLLLYMLWSIWQQYESNWKLKAEFKADILNQLATNNYIEISPEMYEFDGQMPSFSFKAFSLLEKSLGKTSLKEFSLLEKSLGKTSSSLNNFRLRLSNAERRRLLRILSPKG